MNEAWIHGSWLTLALTIGTVGAGCRSKGAHEDLSSQAPYPSGSSGTGGRGAAGDGAAAGMTTGAAGDGGAAGMTTGAAGDGGAAEMMTGAAGHGGATAGMTMTTGAAGDGGAAGTMTGAAGHGGATAGMTTGPGGGSAGGGGIGVSGAGGVAHIQDPLCGDITSLQEGSPWPMFGRCPTHAAQGITIGPQTPKVKWKYSAASGEGAGSIAIANDGTIYYGPGDQLIALTPGGVMKWEAPSDTAVGSPAIAADGTIYASGDYGIWAFDAEGSVHWEYTPWYACGPVNIDGDGNIHALCPSGEEINSTYVVSLSPSGELLWKFPMSRGCGAAPVIGGDGTIYAACSDAVALSSSGTMLWKTPMVVEDAGGCVGDAILANGTLFFSEYTVHALSTSGVPLWAHPNASPEYASLFALAPDGTLHGTIDFSLRSLAPDTGNVDWSVPFEGVHRSSGPVIDTAGTTFGPLNGATFVAVTASGSTLWTISLGSPVVAPVSMGADGTLYVALSDGLVAIGDE